MFVFLIDRSYNNCAVVYSYYISIHLFFCRAGLFLR